MDFTVLYTNLKTLKDKYTAEKKELEAKILLVEAKLQVVDELGSNLKCEDVVVEATKSETVLDAQVENTVDD